MPYQPYYPGGWQPGPGGGTPITADALNHMESQYDAVKEELHKTDGTSDMPITTPGGTEPNRLAVTNGSGRVGDAERVQGAIPMSTTDNLGDVAVHKLSAVSLSSGRAVLLNVTGSGVLLAAYAFGGGDIRFYVTVDGSAEVEYASAVAYRDGWSSASFRFLALPPIRYTSSLKVELYHNRDHASSTAAAYALRRAD